MALTKADIEQFIDIVRNDDAVRERVRGVLLERDFLELPKRVAELQATLEAHISRTDERFDAVDQRFDAVDQRFNAVDQRFDAVDRRLGGIDRRLDGMDSRFDRVELRLDKVEGDVGNLLGSDYETRYVKSAPSRLGRRFLRVKPIVLGNEHAFHEALADGRISDADWDEAILLDFVARAVPKEDSAGPGVLLAVEVSRLVDASDVERVHRRAGILRKVWPDTIAIVDGEQITAGAKVRAQELDVLVMVQRDAAEPPAA